jgi:hypothetical protein
MAGNNLFCFQAERAFLDRHLSSLSLDESRRNPIVKLTYCQAIFMKIFEQISNHTVFICRPNEMLCSRVGRPSLRFLKAGDFDVSVVSI